MTRPVAFTDANVLYVAAVRDLLIELAVAKAITLRWTEAVHDEWTAALARTRPDLDPQRIERTRRLLIETLPDALVTDYEPTVPALQLPDADDRHVLAAAIKGGCQLILTFNVADFPPPALAPHNLAAVHPDAFLSTLCTADPGRIVAAATRIRARLVNPPLSPAAYLSNLAQRDLPLTAQALRALEEQV
jgi:PIN domain-containing protein